MVHSPFWLLLTCHCEAFFAEAIPKTAEEIASSLKNAPRNDNL